MNFQEIKDWIEGIGAPKEGQQFQNLIECRHYHPAARQDASLDAAMSQGLESEAGGMREEILAEGVRLILGDCREVLPTLPHLHAIVTDPPYGIGESSIKVASRGRLAVPKDYGTFDWDKAPPQAWLIEMLQEISDWQIIFGGNYFDLPPSSCWLVWDKKNGSNDFADCELAWTNMTKAVRRIEWLWKGMIRKGSDVREHPTQKPLGVMAWAIDQLPDGVELICDPFMGSGTTGVAAVTRGLRFIGIEREPRYFETAVARVSEALQRPSLLVEPPKPAKQEMLEL